MLAVILAGWEIVTALGWADPLIVSTPQAVARAIPDILGSQAGQQALAITGSEIIDAFVMAVGAGLIAGTILGLSRQLRQAYLPVITFLMSTPKVVFLPLFMLSLGVSSISAAAFGAFEAFFYVTVNVVGGVELVDPRHLRVARAFRAGPLRTFANVVFPTALPGICTALWYGIKHAFLGCLISELWASHAGVGTLIKAYSDQLDTAHVLAIIVIISFVAILAGSLWSRAEARLSRWRRTQAGADAVVAYA
ncbi:MAG: ABC transporter permease subunit [bacterium]|nr:ABC transporter permease subunit [bacterium]